EFWAIMGPSGSGKSTLMHLLGCLDRPTTGKYYFAGQDVARLSDSELAVMRNRRIGFVFQNFQLLPRISALSNVELPMLYAGVKPGERRRRAEAALEKVGLTDRMHHRPTELSGGQKQRVAIARSLVNGPLLLLADEPTGNLDSRASLEIITLFKELNTEGTTVVLITHEPEIGAQAKNLATCLDGRLTVQPTAETTAGEGGRADESA
ncbi:MAG: ABC transporter ATP-binding protein, partial [Heliobacteriaceae bacterium]|nr:ABC transporter ATP-binding protein [Heliobacteriaceae bacterium]